MNRNCSCPPESRRIARGFTLIELLVVVAIIAVLIAMLLPALSSARENARQIVCGSQLSQVGKAMLVYAQDNAEFTPPFVFSNNGKPTAFSSIGHYVADGGMSDLVKKPIGRSNIGYLMDADPLICPNDTARQSDRDPNKPKGWGKWDLNGGGGWNYNGMSYWYLYVTEFGQTNYDILSNKKPGWFNEFYDMQRYKVTGENPSNCCILFDQGYPKVISPLWPLYHPGGWNVLYLDGHANFHRLDDIASRAAEGNVGVPTWAGIKLMARLLDIAG